jgi:hypothetical protein
MTPAFHTETLIALLGVAGSVLAAIGAVIAAWFAFYARKEARGANAAVNNRAPGETPLYDMVRYTHHNVQETNKRLHDVLMWQASYEGGPLDSGPKVSAFVHRVERMDADIQKLKDGCGSQKGG